MSPAIAFGQQPPARPGAASATADESEAAMQVESEAHAVETAEIAETSGAKTMQRFTSDGRAFFMEELGFTIAPPAGWEVDAGSGTLSLILREPKQPSPGPEIATYQRNITVAVSHKGSPIDEKRAAELKEQLTRSFTKDGMVSEFQALEHKFFDYRGTNDGLLVYSSMKLGEEMMMQMHILVSGGDKQFLMTYTDLADRFTNQTDKGFETAWNSMVSVEVTGDTPIRGEEYVKYGAFAGGLLFLGLTLLLLRRKAGKTDYDSAANALEDSDTGSMSPSLMATLAHGWKLDSEEAGGGEDFHFSEAPKTRKTEYVSNF